MGGWIILIASFVALYFFTRNTPEEPNRKELLNKGCSYVALGGMIKKAYDWDQEAQNISKRDRE